MSNTTEGNDALDRAMMEVAKRMAKPGGMPSVLVMPDYVVAVDWATGVAKYIVISDDEDCDG